MRKILIAIIIIAMLFTTVFSTIQLNVAAEEGTSAPATSVATGADVNTAGNKMTPGSGTYSSDDGWVGVSSWSELTSKLAAGAKIYLTGNINAGGADVGTSNGAKLNGTIIDGNGYTITATGPLFQHTNNTTLQNLTLKSTLSGIAAGATPLAHWETKGYTKAYNVTVFSTVTVGATTSGSQSYSGFTIYAQSGSVFENVWVDTTLTLTNAGLTKANSVGAIAGRANKATFNNCIASGTITVGATAYVDSNQPNNGVGGIVGQEIDACSISNCTNKANITVTAPATVNNKTVGGIVGYSDGITLENCLNLGDITVDYTKNIAVDLTDNGTDGEGNATNTGNDSATEVMYVGGIIGYVTSGATNVNKCENQGDVSVKITAKGAMTAAADNATAASTTVASHVGGIMGYSNGTNPTFKGVLNSGNISAANDISGIGINGAKLTATRKAYAAGIIAFAYQQAAFKVGDNTTYSAKNTGEISSDYYAGGIMAYMTWGSGIDDCVNEGAVTATDIVGGIIAYRAGGNQYDNMNRCSNSGTITLKGKASVESEGYAGGLIGRGGYKVDNSTNSGTIIAGKDATNHSGVYVAGIMAYNDSNPKISDVVQSITVTNCTNNGDIICVGLAAGGIVGYTKNNGITVTDCVSNGKVTFTNMKTSTWASAGGILGYGYNSSAGNPTTTEFVNISYCVNNGDIISGIESSGKNEHFGGIVGRVGNPIHFQITNCINNGDMSVSLIDGSSGWAGGIIGASQSYGNSNAYTSQVTDCVNTGEMSACNAAGLLGRANTGGNGTANFVNSLNADGFVNAGKINGVGRSAFLVAFQDRGDTISTVNYNFDNCVNVGEIHGDGAISGGIGDDSFATVTMDNCLISGTFTGNGTRYILAPTSNAVTGSGNYYDKNDVGISTGINANGATADADIASKIRGAGATTVAFDRESSQYVYDYVIANGLSADTSAVAKYVINTRGDSDYTYFTATQAEVDAARQALESAISGNSGETSYVVVISSDIKLAKNAGYVDFEFVNPKLSSKVTVKVGQGGETGDNFKLTSGDRDLEFWFVQDGKAVKQGQNLFVFDGADSGEHQFGAQIKDEAQLYPGVYNGTVTFDIALSE